MFPRTLQLALLASLSSISVSGVVVAQPAGAARVFTIPSQDLGGALIRLARASGRNILFAPELVGGKTSGAVAVAPNFESALRQILTGTGIAYRIDADGAVSLRLQPTQAMLTREAAAEPGSADTTNITEVTVTARKRVERLQDVPISITAISGTEFNAKQYIGLLDVNQLAPSVAMQVATPHTTSIAIRGVGVNPASDGLESGVGVFIDGVYLGRPGMTVLDMIDIDSIGVLRGPQGTLFGKNTSEGAIVITTAAPSFTLSGAMQDTVGNYNYNQFQGFVTGPITDTLAGRLTVYRTSRDGLAYDITTRARTNAIDRYGIRGQLLYRPSDTFDLRVIAGTDSEDDSNASSIFDNGGARPAALQAKLALVGAVFAYDPGGLVSASDGITQNHVRQDNVSAEANWRVGALTLTSLTAWRSYDWRAISDIDGSSADILQGSYNNYDRQFSQELRLATPSGRTWEGVAGAYFFYQRIDVQQPTYYGVDAPVYLSGTNPALPALRPYASTRWTVFANPTTTSYALFAQGTWHVDDRLEITVGARGTAEHKTEILSRSIPVSTLTGQPVAALVGVVFPASRVGTSDVTPSGLVSVSYHVTPKVLTYALMSRGAKSGGVNSFLPASGFGIDSLKVKPEIATNYEAGLKAEFFNDRLLLNGDVFYERFDDYQAAYTAPIPGRTSAFSTVLTNVGAVQTRGFEVEATAAPIAGLKLNGFADYNDATYISYTNAPCPNEAVAQVVCNLTGHPVAGAPPWSVGARGEYSFTLLGNLNGFVAGGYLWRATYYGYLDDSAFSIIPRHSVIDASVGVHGFADRWTGHALGKESR